MTLWLILTVMTSAAALWVAVPLLRDAGRPRDHAEDDIAIYRDQLEEVEREMQDGRIDTTQAESARTEIKRRILAAGQPLPAAPPGLSGQTRGFVVIAATAIVALGSSILYAAIGSPGLAPAHPPLFTGDDGAVQRSDLPPRHPPLAGLTDTAAGGDGDGQAGLPTVEEMTGRLAVRLARNPGDTEGWRTLGWSYLNIGRYSEAAEAYGKASALDPGNAEFRGGRIEALVGAANGAITPEARAAIGELLKLAPKDARARYFAGLASAQDGDKAAALATWTDLLTDAGAGAPADESLLSDVRRRVADLNRGPGERGPRGGTAADGPPAQRVAAGDVRTASEGPDSPNDQAAAVPPPGGQAAMIRGMVDGLASRLERAPRDADGWIKLIRSRVVLGEGGLAKQALARGLAAFADDAAERGRITAAAQELGVRE